LRDRNNVLNEFLIIWTADHGDMNGDHHLWRKGFPWEKSSHIPTMMCLPTKMNAADRVSPPKKARASQAIVEIRDVAPTIYDALGILQQVQQRDPLMNGRSLLPILKGQQTRVREWLDLEHSTLYDKNIHWNAIVGYINDETRSGSDEILWKYIFNAFDGSEQLFNLTNDPNETDDLAVNKDFKEVLGALRKRMVTQFEEEGRGVEFVRNGTLAVREKPMVWGDHFPCLKRSHSHLWFETPITIAK